MFWTFSLCSSNCTNLLHDKGNYKITEVVLQICSTTHLRWSFSLFLSFEFMNESVENVCSSFMLLRSCIIPFWATSWIQGMSAIKTRKGAALGSDTNHHKVSTEWNVKMRSLVNIICTLWVHETPHNRYMTCILVTGKFTDLAWTEKCESGQLKTFTN